MRTLDNQNPETHCPTMLCESQAQGPSKIESNKPVHSISPKPALKTNNNRMIFSKILNDFKKIIISGPVEILFPVIHFLLHVVWRVTSSLTQRVGSPTGASP
jgi:hypothetical protein